MPLKKMHNKNTGKFGEDLAAEFLQTLGYSIIERNWHYSKNAEIDIIAKDKDTLVFVEVKTRSTLACGHPFEAVNYTKLKKIVLAIPAYIAEHNLGRIKSRIDLVAVLGVENPKIEHLKSVGF